MNLRTKFDYQMFLAILTEAEQRIEDFAAVDPQVALNSSETVALCEERMEIEGLTRKELYRRAGRPMPRAAA